MTRQGERRADFVVWGELVMRAVLGSGACGKSRPAARYGGSGRSHDDTKGEKGKEAGLGCRLTISRCG
jgi:hypothetical protein